MNKSFKVLIMLISSISSFSVFANEQSPKNFYIQGNLGVAMGGYPGKDFERNSFGNSRVYGLAIGYKFNENFRADFGIDRRSGFKHKSMQSEYHEDGKQYVLHTENMKVKSWSMMVTGYYDIVEINKFTPYILLGVGIAKNTIESSGDAKLEKRGDIINSAWEKGAKINFAWKIGAGVKYKINDSFDVGLNYQYVDLGIFKTGNNKYHWNDNGPLDTHVQTKRYGKLKSQEVLFNFIFKF